MSAVRIVVDPDPTVWFVGPTDDRPPADWLAPAVELVEQILEVDPKAEAQRRGIAMMLERIGRGYETESALRYQLIRWHSLQEVPFVVTYGLVGRDGQQTEIEDFLGFRGIPGVAEPPVVETVQSTPSTVRRALAYLDDGQLAVGLRHVIDTGHPDAVVLVEASDRDPRTVIGLIEAIDAFACDVRLESDA